MWLHLTLLSFLNSSRTHRDLHSFPTRRSSDLKRSSARPGARTPSGSATSEHARHCRSKSGASRTSLSSDSRSEEHTSELQSQSNLVCRLLLEKKNQTKHSLYSRSC